MASIYELQPGQLLAVPETDQVTQCKMCLDIALPKMATADEGEGTNQDQVGTIRLGELYQYGKPITDPDTGKEDVEVYCAHHFCLLFSSGLEQNGRDDDEGLKGFLPADVLREWRRGQRLKCTICTQKYATVGCAAKSCRKTFHLTCAVRSKALLQYCGQFSLYCHEHRLKQRPFAKMAKRNEGEDDQTSFSCGICYDDIATPLDDLAVIWSPCCEKWFHKGCVQHFADTSGYFFKCPLCNNKDDFVEEMKQFGIYVPEKDAEWEKDNDGEAFESLLERHDNCDAEECVCPEGRKKDEDYTEWEIVLCWYCGARGTHVKCGDLPMQTEPIKWKCDFCRDTLKKMPPKRLHQFTPIKLNRKSSNKALLASLLSRTTISLGENSGISFNVHEKRKVGKTRKTDLQLRYVLSGSLEQSSRRHAEIKDNKVQNRTRPAAAASSSTASTAAPEASEAARTERDPSPAAFRRETPSSPVKISLSPAKIRSTSTPVKSSRNPDPVVVSPKAKKKKKRKLSSPATPSDGSGNKKKKSSSTAATPVDGPKKSKDSAKKILSASPKKKIETTPSSKAPPVAEMFKSKQKSILQYFSAKP